MNLAIRSDMQELMDNPKMDAHKYREAYLDINKCNLLLGGYGITINEVLKLLKSNKKESYTIYDIGCGDGEMLRRLSNTLVQHNKKVSLVGIDLRDDVLDIARSKSIEYGNISFKNQNVLTLGNDNACDILLCTLTMHHFTDKEINIFTKKFSQLARVGVVINDLERNWISYQLFKLFSLFFIKTSIARTDGLISITKGFRKKELLKFAKNIPNVIHHIRWKWAFRYVWVMQTNRLT